MRFLVRAIARDSRARFGNTAQRVDAVAVEAWLEPMQKRITEDEIETAARQLATNEQGRAALQKFGQMLGQEDFELDLLNQRAFLTLLGGAWTARSQRVREAIARALSEPAGNR
jgi:hypothetical protein